MTNLDPNTTYYYRLNAQNSYGTTNENVFSFKTEPLTPPAPPSGNAPTSVTDEATGVTKAEAVLHGQVNPNGAATTYYFEYGKSTLLGLFSLDQKTDTKNAGSGTKAVSVSATLTKLDSNSTYYYRLVSTNVHGDSAGGIYHFTTKKP